MQRVPSMGDTQAAGSGDGVLCAGGTLSVPKLGMAGWLWRVAEMALLYLGAPFAIDLAVHGRGVPVFIALLPVLAIVVMFLAVDRTFSLARELTRGSSLAQLGWILVVFAFGGGVVATYVAQYHPDLFLEFPRQRPQTYERIMLLYPAMSVVAQELVYRTFFFHRYGVLFGRAWWLAIVLNGVLFGIAHIVIGTSLAIYGTMATGTLFAWRYAATRAFWAVFLEHTLWGGLVFTVGLGRYFFAGVGILSWR